MRVMVPPDSELINKMMFPDRKYLVPVAQPASREEKMVCKGEREKTDAEGDGKNK